MSDPKTLREQVARAIYAVNPEMTVVFAPDEIKPIPYDDLPDEWRAVCLQEADAALSLITEACAKVAEESADDSAEGAYIAQRIRQMGMP